MRAVSEAVVMLTPSVKATLFIPTPTSPTTAIESSSRLPGLVPGSRMRAKTRTTSPARTNRIATKGSGGTSATATLTATGLVPRKRTARSSETSVNAAALSLTSVTRSDCTSRGLRPAIHPKFIAVCSHETPGKWHGRSKGRTTPLSRGSGLIP